jgi:preprotein translocase subunit SecF
MSESKIGKFYFKHLKKLAIIPLILFILALTGLIIQASVTGDFMNKDVSLKGGISSTVYTNQEIDESELKAHLGVDSNTRVLGDFSTGEQLGIMVEVSDLNSTVLEEKLESFFNMELTQENYSVEETGPKLGEAFYRQLILALIFALILMGVAVLIAFRTIIPSLAVVFAAITDIIVTLAIVNLFGMQISTAGIVAFLLVIGYSIDTNILLTTRVLKKKELSVNDRIKASAKTGLTMTFTTILALTAGIIFVTSPVIKGMFTIVVIALLVDILTTYFTNAGILSWYVKKKG